MERKAKKKYISPKTESLDMEAYVICDGMSVNTPTTDPTNPNKPVVPPGGELSREGFSDFEESDYDY